MKLAELSTARAAPAVMAAAKEAVIEVGRGLVAVVAAAVIYKSVYSCSPLYSANAYQHTYLLGPKSHTETAQPCMGGTRRSDSS